MPGWLRLYYSSGALARGFDGARRGALGRIDARLRCLVAMSAGGEDGCKPVKNDFTVGSETTQAFYESSVDLKACLKV